MRHEVFNDLEGRIRFFVHPVPALAVLGLGLNDHYLKHAYHSWFTGKLSDLLGTFYFPLFLSALVILFASVLGRTFFLTRGLFSFGALITVTLMALVKWDAHCARVIQTLFSQSFFEIQLTPDRTDLLVLPFSLTASAYFASLYWATSDRLPAPNSENVDEQT